MDVQFYRLAAQEFREARSWYERQQTGLGPEYVREVHRAIDRISAHPERWPIFRDEFHRVRLRRFPYFIFYRIESDELILILAVAHAKRRPGYWLRRGRQP